MPPPGRRANCNCTSEFSTYGNKRFFHCEHIRTWLFSFRLIFNRAYALKYRALSRSPSCSFSAIVNSNFLLAAKKPESAFPRFQIFHFNYLPWSVCACLSSIASAPTRPAFLCALLLRGLIFYEEIILNTFWGRATLHSFFNQLNKLLPPCSAFPI